MVRGASRFHIEVVQDITEKTRVRREAEAEAEKRARENAQLQSRVATLLEVMERVVDGDLRVDPKVEGAGGVSEIAGALGKLVR